MCKVFLFLGAFFCVLFFSLSMTIDPLYVSDQLTYFYLAMVKADIGFLSDDWLASTRPLYPVFMTFVYLCLHFLHPFVFYFFIFLFMGVYVFSLLGIVSESLSVKRRWIPLSFTYLFLIVIHSKWAASFFSWSDLFHPKNFFRGVANQYLITTHFIPSSFDILLLVSIFMFLKKKYYFAIIFPLICVLFHPASGAAACFLMAVYILYIFFAEKNKQVAIKLTVLSLVCLLPTVFYSMYVVLQASDEAMSVFRNVRAADSQVVSNWISWDVGMRVLFFVFSLYIVKRSRLAVVMGGCFVMGAGLTFLQFVTRSSFLAIIVPWRIMAVLTPLSTAIIGYYCFSGVLKMSSSWHSHLKKGVSCFVLLFFVVCSLFSISFGLNTMRSDYNEKMSKKGLYGVISYVKAHNEGGDVYLVPPRTSLFRVNSRSAVFVDFKFFPWENWAGLEWYKRLQLAEEFYASGLFQSRNILKRINKISPITHILFLNDRRVFGDEWEPIYRNEKYVLCKLTR
ncbi:hypothetical protein HOH45_09715 [bacterium]|nr:hypothetical protein [bacterium]